MPWILTGIFIFTVLFFSVRWFLVNSIGARLTPNMGKQVAIGSIILAVLISAVTWPIYEGGFWDYGGLGAMDDVEELETMRGQPADTLVYYGKGDDWDNWGDECLTFSDSSELGVWSSLDEGEDHTKWCVIPAEHWTNWGIFQPTQSTIIDFEGVNGHGDIESGRNVAGSSSYEYDGNVDSTIIEHSWTDVIHVEDIGLSSVFVDVGCNFRTTVRNAGSHTQDLSISNDAGKVLWSTDGECGSTTLKLAPGNYNLEYSISSSEVNETVTMITDFSAKAFQPLLLDANGAVANRADLPAGTDLEAMSLENPTFQKNPKSLDAKLIYSMFIPCLGIGAVVFMLMRSMARGYEWEMNKCYGCDLCDDACPVRLFNAGDKLNIIYNTWNNEDDGVPLYSCLTCTACTNACPQLVDYDSYVDIRRNLIVGGPPAAEIPHSILQAVLAAEAEEDANSAFIPIDEYPIDSSVGYYPGCVDYIDQEMIFSHVNEGEMNLGETTTAAFTIFDEMGKDVTYLGRDFLKCCGHDQKWQGMTEVFEKLKAYNQKKLGDSGIDTLVTSCAECFRTFAMDYELEDMKVMHTTEYLIENGFDMDLATPEDVTVTYHDPCRLGRQMNIYEEPVSYTHLTLPTICSE